MYNMVFICSNNGDLYPVLYLRNNILNQLIHMDYQRNIQFLKIPLVKEKSLVMLGDTVNEKIIRNHLM